MDPKKMGEKIPKTKQVNDENQPAKHIYGIDVPYVRFFFFARALFNGTSQ